MEALLCKIFLVGEHIHVCLSSHEIARAWSELIFGDWQLQPTSSLLTSCVTRSPNKLWRSNSVFILCLHPFLPLGWLNSTWPGFVPSSLLYKFVTSSWSTNLVIPYTNLWSHFPEPIGLSSLLCVSCMGEA
jgi:hypothetical protein